MARLTKRDLGALLHRLAGLYAIRDLNAFPSRVTSALSELVPSEITSYNEESRTAAVARALKVTEATLD